jgi:ribosomal protein L7/L12/DNA-directed RNA polymerase subunit RPC12/RpoP
MTQKFDCPSCGAPLDIDADIDPVIRCPYCNGTVVVPPEMRLTGAPRMPQESVILNAHAGTAGQQDKDAEEITRLAQNGDILQATLRIRSLTGDDLKEAMHLAEGIAAGRPVTLIHVETSEDLQDQAAVWQKLIQLAQSGKKIEAIALLRKLTGVSLADAKRSVEAIQAGESFQISDFITPLPVLNKSAMLDEVARLAGAGKTLDAIRVYRETFDVSLKEAKTAVEKIQAGHLDEVQQMAAQGVYIAQVQPPVSISVAKVAAPLGLGVGCFTLGLIGFILLATFIPIILAMSQRGGPLFNTWSRISPFSYANLAMTFGGEGSGAGLFSDARLLAVDPQNGNIAVAEAETGRIQVFDSAGKFLTQWNAGEKAQYMEDMDIDRGGNLYLTYAGEIHIHDILTGSEAGVIGGFEERAERFTNLATLDDGGLLVVAEGETVVHFTSDRVPEVLLPEAISSLSGENESDAKIAIDGVGNTYLLGIDNQAVFKFDPQGKLVTRFGADGDEEGQFSFPSCILIDNQSRIYISDTKGIQVFAADGRYLDKIVLNGGVFDMDINDQNEIFTISTDEVVSKFTLKSR